MQRFWVQSFPDPGRRRIKWRPADRVGYETKYLCSLVPSPPLPLTKWPRKGMVWYLWAESLVLAIPNNSGQSHRCMVTCLQKSRAKLVGDESQAPFSSMFLSTGYSEAVLMFIYTRGDVFYIPSNGSREVSVLYGASLDNNDYRPFARYVM